MVECRLWSRSFGQEQWHSGSFLTCKLFLLIFASEKVLSGFAYGPMLDGKGWLAEEFVLVEILCQLEAYFSLVLVEKGFHQQMGN